MDRESDISRQLRRICVFDTTLRDGEQSPGVCLSIEDKIKIAEQLEKLRVDVIEAGFPIASTSEQKAVSAITEQIEKPVVAALARCREEDIE
ncbi:MAG: 2-isopropylmalate synthase, partial [Candidatus Diapherotrites archaeon]|nr:2-isopropylmalate synthase [Candidatus Diapherotrites archaeon]